MAFNIYKLLLEDDDDDNDLYDGDPPDGVVLVLLDHFTKQSTSRLKYHVRSRIDWDCHVRELLAESPQASENMCRMRLSSFNKLCCWIDPFVRVNPVKSRNRTGEKEIRTEVVLHCILRWLAGGSHSDIKVTAGISKPSFYRLVLKAADAISKINQLDIRFPMKAEEIENRQETFSPSAPAESLIGASHA